MARPNEADRGTDRALADLEKRINSVYSQAAKELQEETDAFFKHFADQDKKMKDLIGQKRNGKEWTEKDYQQWRLNQMGRGARLEALRDKLAERATEAKEVALAYVNDATPGIYSLNRNYTAYTIESVHPSADFTLFDEQTVKRLIVEQPDVMPYYPERLALKRGIDLAFGKQQITASVTGSILQGRSIKQISDDLQSRIVTMSRVSAIRAARTAVTAAQNAGRMDSYAAADEMWGIKSKKKWVATKDLRTRHDHGMADNQIVDYDQPFDVGGYKMMFPGDGSLGAPGHELYNCRCTVVNATDDDLEAEPHMMRVKNPETGEYELVKKKSYKEWYDEKKAQYPPEKWAGMVKAGKNYQADQREYAEYREILGKKAPKTFAKFQDLKYNNADGWEALKTAKQVASAGKSAITKEKVLAVPIKSNESHYKKLLEDLETTSKMVKLDYNPVRTRTGNVTDDEIVSTLAGGDKTKGSCASVALAYIGQKQGWDVLDFRDGESRYFFCKAKNLLELSQADGISALHYGDVVGKSSCTLANNYLKKCEIGKEYYLCVGRHAAIVRKNESGLLQYLELQSAVKSGWTNFNKNPRYTLTNRFGCSSSSGHGEYYDFMISITDSDFGTDDFKSLLGYINTAENEQRKGSNGTIK